MLNIYEAKTNLSHIIRQVQEGNVVTLCKNGEPVAQVVPFKKRGSAWEKMGSAKEWIGTISPRFNDPLTDEELPGFGL